MTTFTEKQKMNGVWIAVIPSSFLACLATYKEMKPISEDWKNILPLITTILIMVSICIFMYMTELRTQITNEFIQVRYFPFHLKPKTFYWNDITSFETRSADSLNEYWGWGIRGTKKNRACTAYGDYGIQLTFQNGNRLFIGSQKKEELEAFINTLKDSNNSIA